jgi:aspartyl-tRNA(Asn)/glutamyl-tRNA(Gln) amidotransferase subunit A
MSVESDIIFLSAAETARAVREKRFSPTEVTEAYLQRIERLNPSLNAYITVTADLARAQAKETEKRLMAGDTKGPLFGVPVAVKDQFWTNGIRTSLASSAYKDFVPGDNATIITRLEESGAPLLGKLSLAALAALEEDPPPFGECRNAWDSDRHPGGSSHGSGLALSTHLCGASIGEDTGGSGRNPASWSGVTGIRPTYGRVSRHGVMAFAWYLDIAAPMGKTVEDVALILEAIAGYDAKDPYTSKRSVPQYSASLGKSIKGMRIGVVKELMTDEVDTEVRENVWKALDVLKGLGAHVEEVSVPMLNLGGVLYTTLAMPEGASAHAEVLRTRHAQIRKPIRTMFYANSLLPAYVINDALKAKALLRQELLDTYQRFDVLASPNNTTPAPLYADYTGRGSMSEEVIVGLMEWLKYCGGYAMAAMPALSVPCGFTVSEKPLPIGLQISGPPFMEERILQVAHSYQMATDWHTRRAPAALQ